MRHLIEVASGAFDLGRWSVSKAQEKGDTYTLSSHTEGSLGLGHHDYGFSMWMAGGGIKPGITHGATDELGMHAIKDRVLHHDLHATILYLLGFDHERLTLRRNSRDFRLTDVYGNVVNELIA